MAEFDVKIVSPDALIFEGKASFLRVRTITGDIGISGAHANYFGIIDYGECFLRTGGTERHAACADGFLSVLDGSVKLILTTFEWAEDIDEKRADEALILAQEHLTEVDKKSDEYQIYLSKLKRAETRKQIVSKYLTK